MEIELASSGLNFEAQKLLNITYHGHQISGGFRADLVVEGLVLVELKSAQKWEPIFEAQVMTYLKLTELRLGLLLNFNVPQLREGIKRVVRGLDDPEFGSLHGTE